MQRKKPKATTKANAKVRAGKGNGGNERKGKDTGIPKGGGKATGIGKGKGIGAPASISK
jgi:hypothetical protein